MVDVEINDEQANVFLTEAPQRITRGLVEGMIRVGQGLLTRMKRNIRNTFDTRTGNMGRAAFQRTEVSPDGQSVQVIVGGDLRKAVYFRVQDRGGVITPKMAMNLAIPTDEVRTEAGVPRFTAREVFANPQAYGYAGVFIRRGVVFGRRPGGQIAPLFVLKPSVTLHPTGFMARTLSENKEWIRATIAAGLDDSLGVKA